MLQAGITFFDFTTKHHEGFSMYDTNTRVHDCWDFDLTPGAKTVKGIKPCLSPGKSPPAPHTCRGVECKYKAVPHTKSNAPHCSLPFVSNVTVEQAQAVCSADVRCAGFDFYTINDSGKQCAFWLAPGRGCASFKTQIIPGADASNTLYTKVGWRLAVEC